MQYAHTFEKVLYQKTVNQAQLNASKDAASGPSAIVVLLTCEANGYAVFVTGVQGADEGPVLWFPTPGGAGRHVQAQAIEAAVGHARKLEDVLVMGDK